MHLALSMVNDYIMAIELKMYCMFFLRLFKSYIQGGKYKYFYKKKLHFDEILYAENI